MNSERLKKKVALFGIVFQIPVAVFLFRFFSSLNYSIPLFICAILLIICDALYIAFSGVRIAKDKMNEKGLKLARMIFGIIFILTFLPILYFAVSCAYDTLVNFTYVPDGCYSSSLHYFLSTLTWQVLGLSFSPPVFPLCFIYQLVYIVVSITYRIKKRAKSVKNEAEA